MTTIYFVRYAQPNYDNHNDLEAEYHTILEWDEPAAGCQWSAEQKAAFTKRAHLAYKALCAALGENYTVLDELDKCVR